MTYQSPRIYTYKITFEEVPYYYYGVHKEREYNEYYMGSPVTNKWCWELYTPKKQILEFFEFSDEGYIEAQEVEKRIVTPVLNDKWCLNENVGGVFSLKTHSKAGKKGGTKTYELGVGLHSITTEERREIGRKSGYKTYELGIGAFGISKEKRKETNKKVDEINKMNGTGIYSRTKEQQVESGKNWGKKASSQRWMCEETGHISTPGGLARYQKARDIDTSKRVRIS
jgi:hypothetical protein